MMTVTVSQTDINNGRMGTSTGCPVALAFARAAGCAHASVGDYLIALVDADAPPDEPIRMWNTPTGVAAIIATFDRTGRMSPFAFTIGAPNVE